MLETFFKDIDNDKFLSSKEKEDKKIYLNKMWDFLSETQQKRVINQYNIAKAFKNG